MLSVYDADIGDDGKVGGWAGQAELWPQLVSGGKAGGLAGITVA